MEEITRKNISDFFPSYPDYEDRRLTTITKIGVESVADLKDYCSLVEQINQESALGLSKQEVNIIALILTEEEANKRFVGEDHIHPDFRGNTGEHPIFMSHKIDDIRAQAGYGPKNFANLSPDHQLAAARFFQGQHVKCLVHDAGEFIDISYADQTATGATLKEPEEEALVGPFKIKLAAYAISKDEPQLYVTALSEIRQRLQNTKDELFEQALRKGKSEQAGNEFIKGVGEEISRIIKDTTEKIAGESGDLTLLLRDEYKPAADTLTKIFEATQNKEGIEPAMTEMFDKIEGNYHMQYFAGRGKTPATKATPLMERLYNGGQSLSYHLASSEKVISQGIYSLKVIPRVLALANAMPESVEKEVVLNTARKGCAFLVRNYIRILQKSPPLIDLTKADSVDAVLTGKEKEQNAELAKRLQAQRGLNASYVSARKKRKGPLTEPEGVIDTKTWIAILDKAANAIEYGAYIPKKSDIPIGIGTLPPVLQVTPSDVARCSKDYPLEVATAYRNDGIKI